MAITAANFLDFLEPGLSNIWHDPYDAEESKYNRFMNVRQMDKNTVTDLEMGGFGALQNQPDGDSIVYDEPTSTRKKSYTYAVRGLGYKIHERLWMNDLYGQVERFERDLKDAAMDDVETSATNILNNGFSTANTGFDGLALFSTAHTRLDGGATQANRPSTDEALSLSALHNAIITMAKWKNENGRPRMHTPKLLLVPSDLIMVAQELLESMDKPGTANNDKNVLRNYGLDWLELKHLTSTTAWFLEANKHDLNFLWMFKPQSGSETDFDTETIKRKVRQGYVAGFGSWKGIYGTDGVA